MEISAIKTTISTLVLIHAIVLVPRASLYLKKSQILVRNVTSVVLRVIKHQITVLSIDVRQIIITSVPIAPASLNVPTITMLTLLPRDAYNVSLDVLYVSDQATTLVQNVKYLQQQTKVTLKS